MKRFNMTPDEVPELLNDCRHVWHSTGEINAYLKEMNYQHTVVCVVTEGVFLVWGLASEKEDIRTLVADAGQDFKTVLFNAKTIKKKVEHGTMVADEEELLGLIREDPLYFGASVVLSPINGELKIVGASDDEEKLQQWLSTAQAFNPRAYVFNNAP